MARPIKCRRIEKFPDNTYFVPLGKRKCDVDEVVLKLEEIEAMRLKDIEGLNQQECAEKMQVSRQTFQNIIDSARRKTAEALTQGKAINISGGNYITGHCMLKCNSCGKIYEVQYPKDKFECPECGSKDIICTKRKNKCHRWCQKEEE